jgi:hypothetical protein
MNWPWQIYAIPFIQIPANVVANQTGTLISAQDRAFMQESTDKDSIVRGRFVSCPAYKFPPLLSRPDIGMLRHGASEITASHSATIFARRLVNGILGYPRFEDL